MKKRIMSIFLTLMVAVSLLPIQVSAAGSVSMNVYNQVIKTNNTVYCTGAGGIYKATLYGGKVKTVKKLYNGTVYFSAYRSAACMRKRGNVLYFMVWNDSCPGGWIKRVHVNTGRRQSLTGFVSCLTGYVIKDRKIYYGFEAERDDDFYEAARSMSLSGKSKKAANVKVYMKERKTNAAGYSTIVKKKGRYAYDYLRTSKGTFYLGRKIIKTSY